MADWIWLDRAAIQAIHEEQLAEHGGGTGVRDEGLMDSALARPQQLAYYGTPDAAAVAAAYGFGLARNHPFVDGNKRTAFVAAELFLALNGFDLIADDEECVLTVLALASGTLTEEAFATWIRQNTVKL
ncbi:MULTISPECIES: type II toxin-antitoxin system death-on-curing family toxin [unclassified Rhizobacter]|uniref:type II toxin-antitoxin system death-on-curing family toxin n=1 Tax=unclassified Rhizobacter TaxID=2640088 RepID=UPI0006FF83F8|nr:MULTISPECIES: type II toxin-antitoxin system death-on-curing family toxin [unclassified Rhizobacter]KQU78556.1 death-on-curing protein [Rhizobacter sp. Root29]KQW10308.1 death-on-curing protein [Rhizobacter sp. Root1238]KRB20278.1 death-on-curing protein [Rhizobacter sp. Root16D2]